MSTFDDYNCDDKRIFKNNIKGISPWAHIPALSRTCYFVTPQKEDIWTQPCFNVPEDEAFSKHCEKRRKCWLPMQLSLHFPKHFQPISRMTAL